MHWSTHEKCQRGRVTVYQYDTLTIHSCLKCAGLVIFFFFYHWLDHSTSNSRETEKQRDRYHMGERGKPDQLTLLCFLAIMQKQEVAPGSRRKEKVAPGAFCGSPHYRQLILASIISHVWMGGGWGSHNHHYRSAQRGIDAWNAELSDSFRRFNGANTTGTALHNLLVFV